MGIWGFWKTSLLYKPCLWVKKDPHSVRDLSKYNDAWTLCLLNLHFPWLLTHLYLSCHNFLCYNCVKSVLEFVVVLSNSLLDYTFKLQINSVVDVISSTLSWKSGKKLIFSYNFLSLLLCMLTIPWLRRSSSRKGPILRLQEM